MGRVRLLRENVTFQDENPAASDARDELLAGLLAEPKTDDPKYFYDAVGSQLFARITRLPALPHRVLAAIRAARGGDDTAG